MARLIRTEKEVEGRFEEVWLVVEEDALEQWPEGPLEVVGRPAARIDGLGRARGEAVYTADIALPGTLHTAVLRSPHARAEVARIDLAAARAAPGVRGAIAPGDCDALTAACEHEGAAVAAVCADTLEQARAAVELIEIEWRVLTPLLDPDEAVARGELIDARTSERGDVEAGLAQADAVVEATYRTQTVLHNSLETHQSVCRFIGDTLEVYTSTQFVWGVRDELAAAFGLDPDRVRVICDSMGGGFGSKTAPGDYTVIAVELARRTGRPVRCALTRREENTIAGNRNATIQRLVAGVRADGTITALRGEFVNAVGASGWSSMVEGPMQMLYACANVRTTTHGARVNLPPMRAFRAPGLRRGHLRARVPPRRARRPARAGPARAAAREPRRGRPARGAAVLREEPARVLPARGAALGAPARGARPLDRQGQVRRRPRVADLVRRRRPAELRLGADRLGRTRGRRHRRPGRRHRHPDRARPDRRRGARPATRARDALARRHGPRAVRDVVGRLLDDSLAGPRRPRRGRRREAPAPRARSTALRGRGR